MKKSAAVSLLAVVLLLALAAPSHAWRGHGVRGHVFIGVGPGVWWGPGPYWWYYPPPPYVYAPPTVIVQEPPVYTQQQIAPMAPPAPPQQQSYWYYCQSAQAYYPNTPSCPEAWIKVPPRPQ
jgi:hypothetical protein